MTDLIIFLILIIVIIVLIMIMGWLLVLESKHEDLRKYVVKFLKNRKED